MKSKKSRFGKIATAVLGISLVTIVPSSAQSPASATSFQKALQHQRQMRPAQWLSDRTSSRSTKGVRPLADGNIIYSDNRWEFIGPRGIQIVNGTTDPYVSGRVSAVAIDNRTPGTAIAASAYGGPWKTTDFGFSWIPLGDASFPYLACASVAIDPTNSRTIYVGLGDFKGEMVRDVDTFSNARASGIMKSVNGGNTWVNIGIAEMRGSAVSDIAIDPDNPRIILATTGVGSSVGIWRSADGGTTWRSVTPTGAGGAPILGRGRGWSAVRVFNRFNRPRTFGTRYYYASCEGEGVYRSADRGVTWTKLDVPLRFNNASGGGAYIMLAEPSSTNANTVYVIDGDGIFADGRLFKGVRNPSNDVYRWTDITGNYPTNAGPLNNWLNAGGGSLFTASPILVQDAGNPFNLVPTDLVSAGVSSISSSLGGTPSWGTLDFNNIFGLPQDAKYDPFSPIDHLIATRSGLFGATFSPTTPLTPWFYDTTVNRTLGVTQFYQADFHPTNPNEIVGGAHLVGSVRSDGDLLNGWKLVSGGWGTSSAFNPTQPAEQYSINRGLGGNGAWPNWFILYTRNNWQNAIEISPGQSFPGATTTYAYPYAFGTDSSVSTAVQGQTQAVTPILVVDPTPQQATDANGGQVLINPMYLGTNALWRFDPPPAAKAITDPMTQSPANGQWRQVGTTTFDGVVTAIAIGNGGNTIYVGTAAGSVYTTARNVQGQTDWIALSEDTNGALNTPWLNVRANLPGGPITSIDINPFLPSDILVTVSGTGFRHVWRCQDTTANSRLYTPQDGLNPTDFTSLPDVPVNGITRDPSDPVNTWYISTDIGVFATNDKGSNWFDATTPLGLPNVKGTSIRAVAGTGFLNVATYGRGIWRFNLNTAVENIRQPRLSVSYSLSRSGGELFSVVTIKNAAGPTVGPAFNVTLDGSAIQVGAASTSTTTPAPITLGTIGPGTQKSVSLRYPGSAGTPGALATFGVTYSAIGAPGASYTNRTRLP